jgi:hypothetical protein
MLLFKSRDEYLVYRSVIRVDNKPVCKKGKPCGDVCIPKRSKCNLENYGRYKSKERKELRRNETKKLVNIAAVSTVAGALSIGALTQLKINDGSKNKLNINLEKIETELDANLEDNHKKYISELKLYSEQKAKEIEDYRNNKLKEVEQYKQNSLKGNSIKEDSRLDALRCKKGKPCGEVCIPKNRKCTVDEYIKQREKNRDIERKIKETYNKNVIYPALAVSGLVTFGSYYYTHQKAQNKTVNNIIENDKKQAAKKIKDNKSELDTMLDLSKKAIDSKTEESKKLIDKKIEDLKKELNSGFNIKSLPEEKKDSLINYQSGFNQILKLDSKLNCKKGKPCGDVCIPKKYKCKYGQNKNRLNTNVTKREFNKIIEYEKKIKRETKQNGKIKSLLLGGLFTATGMYYGGCIYSQLDLRTRIKTAKENLVESRKTNNRRRPTFKHSKSYINSYFKEDIDTLNKVEEQWFKDYWWTVSGVDHAIIEKTFNTFRLNTENTKKQFLREKEAYDFNAKFTTEEDRSWDTYKKVEIDFEKEFKAKNWTEALKIKPENLPKDPKERMKYIKKQYSRLAKEAHPDLNPNNPNAENEMKSLNKLMDWIENNQNNLF